MSIKERTYIEIEQDINTQKALRCIIESADTYLSENPIPQAGDHFKSELKYKGEIFQRLIKSAHREYNGKCKIPEVRFSIFGDGRCTMVVLGQKKF